MSRKITMFIFLFLLVVAQVSFLPNFFAVRHIPDLVLLVLIFFTIRRGFEKVWLVAVAAGLLMDLFSFFQVGTEAFSFTLSILVVSLLAQRFFMVNSKWKFLVLIFLIVVGTAVNDFATSFLLKIFSGFSGEFGLGFPVFNRDILFKILNNLLLFIFVYWFLSKFEKIKGYYEERLPLRK